MKNHELIGQLIAMIESDERASVFLDAYAKQRAKDRRVRRTRRAPRPESVYQLLRCQEGRRLLNLYTNWLKSKPNEAEPGAALLVEAVRRIVGKQQEREWDTNA